MSSAAITNAASKDPSNLFLKGTLLVTSTLTVMAGATIAPALPSISVAFADIPNIEFIVRLVLTLPALFIAIGAPFAGIIVDKFGRKKLLIASAVLYGVAGGAGFLVTTIWMLLVSRALLGLAVAGIMTTVTTLIADYYKGQERSAFLGIQGAFSGMGGVIFLSLGGFLADVGWRSPFLIYLFSFVMLPFIVANLYEPSVAKQIDDSETQPTKLPVGLLAFIYLTMILTQVVFYAVPVQLPFYLEDLVNATAGQSGLAIAGLSLFFSIASASFGWFDKRFANLSVMLAGFTITGIGFIIMTLAIGWVILGVGLILSGFGLGLVVPNLITWLAKSVSEHVRGRALGGVTMSLFLGQFLSPFVIAPLTSITGDGQVYSALGIFLLVIVLAGFVFRNAIDSLTASSQKQ